MDSWLYDDNSPFIHIDALDTFAFLKEQIGTSYYEDLIQKYLLDNTHASIVMICPKKGMAAEADQKLKEKLKAYKESLSKEEVEKLVQDTKDLRAYQERADTAGNSGEDSGAEGQRYFRRHCPDL